METVGKSYMFITSGSLRVKCSNLRDTRDKMGKRQELLHRGEGALFLTLHKTSKGTLA